MRQMMLKCALVVAAIGVAIISVTPVRAMPVKTVHPLNSSHPFGKSHLVQNPAWVALKNAYKVKRPGYAPPQVVAATSVTPDCVTPCPPASYSLNYASTQAIWEPQGANPKGGCTYDAGGDCYIDAYMWKLCGPGATNVALYYWGKPSFSYSNGKWFSDPHTQTYWSNTYGHSYTMYLATLAYPPSFISAGEEAYGSYPTAQTYVPDVRDTLNWEASGHNVNNWSTYFYALVWYDSLSSGQLNNDVMYDLWYVGAPPIVDVNAKLLPNWKNDGGWTSHYVAIVGYTSTTFTYIDTCGVGCNNSGKPNGVYTVSKSTMYNAIQNNNGTGALIW